jgi:hypothetical protein
VIRNNEGTGSKYRDQGSGNRVKNAGNRVEGTGGKRFTIPGLQQKTRKHRIYVRVKRLKERMQWHEII